LEEKEKETGNYVSARALRGIKTTQFIYGASPGGSGAHHPLPSLEGAAEALAHVLSTKSRKSSRAVGLNRGERKREPMSNQTRESQGADGVIGGFPKTGLRTPGKKVLVGYGPKDERLSGQHIKSRK